MIVPFFNGFDSDGVNSTQSESVPASAFDHHRIFAVSFQDLSGLNLLMDSAV